MVAVMVAVTLDTVVAIAGVTSAATTTVTTIDSGRDEAHLLAERTEKRVYTSNVYSKILCTRKVSCTHAPVHAVHMYVRWAFTRSIVLSFGQGH